VRSSDIIKSTLYFCDAAETKLIKNANVRINSALMSILISRILSESSLLEILLPPTKKFNFFRSLPHYPDSGSPHINRIRGFDFFSLNLGFR